MADDCGSGENEFRRMLAFGDLDRGGVTMEISAEAHELAALARRFGLVAIESLAAKVTLERDEADPILRLRGHFTAHVTQSCVVSLEPVVSPVEGAVEGDYTTDADAAAQSVRHMAPDDDVAPGEDDLPELLEGGEIDIGEVVAEQLGINLDPYPRRPGAVFSAAGEELKRISPFAVLRDLKRLR